MAINQIHIDRSHFLLTMCVAFIAATLPNQLFVQRPVQSHLKHSLLLPPPHYTLKKTVQFLMLTQLLVPVDAGFLDCMFGCRRRRAAAIIPCPKGHAGKGNKVCTKCTSGMHVSEDDRKLRLSSCKSCTAGKGSEDPFAECTDCKPGQYSEDGTGCKLCGRGKYQGSEGMSTCLPCPGGTASKKEGKEICQSCQSGYFTSYNPNAVVGPFECVKCPVGYYQSVTESISCSACSLGRYVDSSGSKECDNCVKGRYSSETGKTQCQLCSAGKYQSSSRSAECTFCEAGRVGTVAGQSACLPCPAGKNQENEGKQNCNDCAPGQFSKDQGKQYCKDCVAGQYSSTSGENACTLCAVGQFQNYGGLSVCKDCLPGMFQDSKGSESCSPCTRGFFSETINSIECKKCPLGKYQNSVRAEDCTDCRPGQSTQTTAARSCDDCPKGWHADAAAQQSCDKCAAGKYAAGVRNIQCAGCSLGRASGEGADECDVCSVGQYQSTDGPGTCQKCPLGWYQGAKAASGCISCDAGFHSDVQGMSQCKQCEPGKFNTQGTQATCNSCPGGKISYAAAKQCMNCAAGKQSQNGLCLKCDKGKFSHEAADICSECNGGQYTSQVGQASCQVCPSGFSASLGAISCGACTPGKFAASMATSCTACLQGQAQPNEREANCVSCLPGAAQPAAGASKCDECTPGQIQSALGQGSCNKCAPGMYTSTTGNTKCELCDIGKYADTHGLSDCIKCIDGTFSPTKGSSQCASCSIGQIVNPTTGACIACSKGKFINVMGATECKSCAAGKFAPAKSMSNCDECSVGQYASDKGYTICKLCESGKYAETTSASTCKTCSPGKFTGAKGTAICTACAKGTYTAGVDAHTECNVCPMGYAAESEGLRRCSDCTPGKAAKFEGSTSCEQCRVGKNAQNSASKACSECVKGQKSSLTGASTCQLCGVGRFGYAVGLSECRMCIAGQVASSEGSQSCVLCEAGKFALQGGTECTNCEKSKYQDKIGQGRCEDCGQPTVTGSTECTDEKCSAGKYKVSAGVCEACPLGKYQGARDENSCKECPKGYFSGLHFDVTYTDIENIQTTNNFGADSCNACPEGRFGLERVQHTEALSCSLCRAGRWSGEEGLAATTATSACKECPLGRYSSVAGLLEMTNCELCVPGKYNDVVSANDISSCIECSAGKYSIESGAVSPNKCLNCGEGEYQLQPGGTTCLKCAAGQFNSVAGTPACLKCTHGKYQNEIGKTACKLAVAGKYTTGWETNRRRSRRLAEYEGATSRSDAREGTYTLACSNEDGTETATGCTSVDACPQGWIGSTPPSGKCTSCEVGRHSGEGTIECVDCGAGAYTESSGSATCLYCPEGWSSPGDVSSGCVECGSGQYSPGEKESACSICEEGQYSSNSFNIKCITCPDGFVQPEPEKGLCKACEVGKRHIPLQLCEACSKGAYQPAKAASNCLLCPNGWNQLETNGIICIQCLVGQYMVSTQKECESCNAGQYQPEDGRVGCKDCDPGQIQNEVKQTSCIDCTVGFYASKQGLTKCESCMPGFFAEANIAFDCQACPQGWIQKDRESTICVICDIGQYQWEQVCELCDPGQYSTEKAVYEKCTDCPAGFVQVELNSTSCVECVEGKFVGTRGQQTCEFCALGKFEIDTKSTACSDCPRGYVRPTSYPPTGCFQCPKGQESNDETQLCDDCEVGLFAPTEGSEQCSECPSGFMQGLTGSDDCEICSIGQHANKDIIATSCNKCPSGWFGPKNASVKCNECPSGWVQKYSRFDFCTICPIGKEAESDFKATTCNDCEAGFFSPKNASYNDKRKMSVDSRGCRVCPAGWYIERKRSSECTICETGKKVINTLLPKGCEDCYIGRYAAKAGSISCEGCPKGWKQDKQGRSKCRGCERGQFATRPKADDVITVAATVCYDCPRGFFQGKRTSAACGQCPSGFYEDTSKQHKCKNCPSGYETGSFDDTRIGCDGCEAGRYSARGEPCLKCPRGWKQNEPKLSFCERCQAGYFSEPGAHRCRKQPKDVDMIPPRMISLLPVDRNTNKMKLLFNLNKQEFFGKGSTPETKRNGGQYYDRMGILFQWSNVDAAKNFPDLNARPTWENLHCDESSATNFPGTKSYMDSLYFFCLAATYTGSMHLDKLEDDDDVIQIQVWNHLVEKHQNRTNQHNVIGEYDDITIEIEIKAIKEGPVWDNPLYIRGAFYTSTGTTSAWTRRYGGTTTTSDCKNSESLQEYLRTHPRDNTCMPPLNLIDVDNSTGSSSSSDAIACISCPPGGNCLTQDKTLAAGPKYSPKLGMMNPMDRFDVGSHSAPALVDIDGDGDADMFVGNSAGNILYFENNGHCSKASSSSANWNWTKCVSSGILWEPSFMERRGAGQNPLNGVNAGDKARPAFADIDGDGDYDMFIGNGHSGGVVDIAKQTFDNQRTRGDVNVENGGNLLYFENVGNSKRPTFRQRPGIENPMNEIDFGSFASPALKDIDGDGDPDMFIGKEDGTIAYFKNTGSITIPIFTEMTGIDNPMDSMHVGMFSSPALEDIDGDGDVDMLVGDSTGFITYFENTGNVNSSEFMLTTGVYNPMDGINAGLSIGLALKDMDGDKDVDLFVGESYGKLKYFKNMAVPDALAGLMIPRPGMYVWDVGKLENHWRVPWAPVEGERINKDGDLVHGPQWFYPCPKKGNCYGVSKMTRMWGSLPQIGNTTNNEFIGGWNNNVEDNMARKWTCPEQHPAPRCKKGTGGPLCAMCIDNWTRIQGECRRCYTIEARLLLLAFVVIFGLAFGWLVAKAVKRCRHFHNAFRDASRIVIVGLNLAQIMSAAKTMIPVPWPPVLLWFFEQLDFVNLDITSLTGATCNKEVNFHVQFIAMAAIPIVVVAILALQFYRTKAGLRKKLRYLRKHKESQAACVDRCYSEMFDLIDADGSESIDAKELKNLLQLVGYHQSSDKIVDEKVTAELIQVLCNSRFATQLNRNMFLNKMTSGKLAEELDDILHQDMNLKDRPHRLHLLHDGFDTYAWNEQRKLVVSHLSMGMQALMLLHAPVSRKVFQFFDCDLIGAEDWGRSFLRSDYSIPCRVSGNLSASYITFIPLVLIVLFAFTIGLPMLVSIYFIRNRKVLYTPVVMIRIGWMYHRHPVSAEYWEIIELLRKMVLTGIVVFFPPNPVVRASFCLLVCFLATGVLNYVRPHKNNLVFWVEQLGYTVTLLLYIAGIIFSDAVELEPKDAETVGLFTIAFFMVFMTLSMIAIVLTILLVQQDIDIEIASSQSRMTKIGPMRSGRSASQHLQDTVNAKMNRILEIKALHQKDATPLLKNNQHKKTTVVYPAKTETTSEFKNAEKKTSSAIDNILFEPMMKSQPSLKSKKTLGIRSKKRQSQISREADRAVVDSASKRAQYMVRVSQSFSTSTAFLSF